MKIFLGYPNENLTEARRIYALVSSLGIDIWFDKEKIVGGDDFRRTRELAQKEADQVIYVFSEAINKRAGEIQRELKQALDDAEAQPPTANYFVPVRAHEMQLPPEFATTHYIDIFKGDWALNLSLSIRRRYEQLRETIPETLTNLIQEEGRKADRVQIEIKEENSHGTREAIYFRYLIDERYFDLINAHIAVTALDSYFQSGDVLSTENPTDRPHFSQSRVEEFFRKGKIVSLSLYYSEYTGGAHANYGVTAKNFGGPNIGYFSLGHLFGFDSENLKFLIDRVRSFVTEDKMEDPYLVDLEEIIAENDWTFLNGFNFDANGIVLSFSPYALMPYSFGVVEVRIAWSDVLDKIDDTFKQLVTTIRVETPA